MSEGQRDVQVFQDASGQWRWRRIAGNNRIVAVNGESLTSRTYAIEAAFNENPDVASVSVHEWQGAQETVARP